MPFQHSPFKASRPLASLSPIYPGLVMLAEEPLLAMGGAPRNQLQRR